MIVINAGHEFSLVLVISRVANFKDMALKYNNQFREDAATAGHDFCLSECEQTHRLAFAMMVIFH